MVKVKAFLACYAGLDSVSSAQFSGFRPKGRNDKKQHGFTITELIVTLVIFAVAIPALIGFINMINGVNDRARDLSTINALVENKIESLRSISFTGLTDGTTNFTTELPEVIAPPRSATYQISPVSESLKQVDVTVEYNDRGEQRTLEYKAYIGELGVGQY